MAEPAHRPPPPLFRTIVDPIRAFTRLEAAGGIALFGAALVAFVLANSPWREGFERLWTTPVELRFGPAGFEASLRQVIDDGLMTIFFFVVGMEIKRELVEGELRKLRQALLPGIAAAGGVLLPASIFFALNRGTPGEAGWAIPMATDIAFSIGCIILLGRRVPRPLLVFLTALAIFDDIAGILVIALFYGGGLHVDSLAWVLALVVVVWAVARLGVESWLVYAAGGVGMWIALHHAGIHGTLAGVILGLLIPAVSRRPARQVLREVRRHSELTLEVSETLDTSDLLYLRDEVREAVPPLQRFEHALHPWVAFVIMPLFALANSGVSVAGMTAAELTGPVFLGVALGLFVGKQLGIFAFTWAAVKLGVADVPGGAPWSRVYGVAMVAGIGFTVALFIANLAFGGDPALLKEARLGVLLGSLASGLSGMLVLRFLPARTTRAVPAPATEPA
ncbi:MAG: Na+/H+ antiporter NhaA [Myxococcaceae bacterium]|nr:MAG: Na+/H+ antiporter NhaA [Myxococcaceae bacterium]